jgi:hypothetical protein
MVFGKKSILRNGFGEMDFGEMADGEMSGYRVLQYIAPEVYIIF